MSQRDSAFGSRCCPKGPACQGSAPRTARDCEDSGAPEQDPSPAAVSRAGPAAEHAGGTGGRDHGERGGGTRGRGRGPRQAGGAGPALTFPFRHASAVEGSLRGIRRIEERMH